MCRFTTVGACRRCCAATLVVLLLLFDGTAGFSQAAGSIEDEDRVSDDAGALTEASVACVTGDGPENERGVGADKALDAYALAFRNVAPSVVSVFTMTSGDYQSLGSGIIISEDGLVLTCEHNIEDAKRTYVIMADRRVFRANILGRDGAMDAAVLQILTEDMSDEWRGKIFRAFAIIYEGDTPQIAWNATLPPPVVLGNSTALSVGSQVLAIGFNSARGNEAHAGIVTSFSQAYDNKSGFRYILTDAGIYNGYSGGPLVDISTNTVVGIHSHTIHIRNKKDKSVREERNAILSIDEVKEFLPRMIGGETVSHGTIGKLGFLGLTRDLAQDSLSSGVEIVYIESNCKAGRAGLRRGDVIIEIGGEEVKTARAAEMLIDQAPIGKKIEIVVMRNQNSRKIVKVKPSAMGRLGGEKKMPLLCIIDWLRSITNLLAWVPW